MVTAGTGSRAGGREGEARRPGTVLVVEDDALVQRALLRLLRTAGHRAEAFGSVQAFFAQPLPDEPACLVLDLHLPGGHGLEILDRLAAAGELLPAVVITAHGNVPTTVRAMKRGAIELLEKPFDQQRLLAAVAEGLERSARERAERRLRATVEACIETLTPREVEVLDLVVAGLANKQIGGRLGVAEQTVKVHRARVMEKMRAASLAELVRRAAVVGIGSPEPP